MHHHRTATRSSKNIPFCQFILLVLYAGSAYAATVDPDLTTFEINSAMLAAETEDAPLMSSEFLRAPSKVAVFSTGKRPYSADSIWNTHVNDTFYKTSKTSKASLTLHEQSKEIIKFMAETTAYTDADAEQDDNKAACKKNPSDEKIRFGTTWISPIHIVNSTDKTIMSYVKGELDSKKPPIYNQWDADRDFWLDSGQTTPLYKWVVEKGKSVKKKLWGEPRPDGHIVLVDENIAVTASNTELFDPPSTTQYGKVWEMSHYRSFYGAYCVIGKECSWDSETYLGNYVERATVSTYTLWSLTGKGYGNLPTFADYPGTNIPTYWQHFGGRGSGMPILGGSLRLAEFNHKSINHALVFTFPMNRKGSLDSGEVELFVYPPAVRSDGKFLKEDLPVGDITSYNVNLCQKLNHVKIPYGKENPAPYPLEGMRLRLKGDYVHAHTTTAVDSEARKKMNHLIDTLKNYGMFLADNGGPMALEIELLAKEPVTPTNPKNSITLAKEANSNAWAAKSAVDVYTEIAQIPISAFEVLGYGLQATNSNTGKTTPITGNPYMMSDNLKTAEPCCWNTKENLNP